MGIKQIPTRKFKKFLKSQGVVFIRSHGDHDIYDRPGKPLLRPITIISSCKDIPVMHIHTSLKNLGMTIAEYEEIMKAM